MMTSLLHRRLMHRAVREIPQLFRMSRRKRRAGFEMGDIVRRRRVAFLQRRRQAASHRLRVRCSERDRAGPAAIADDLLKSPCSTASRGGSQTSISICESAEGVSVEATRQCAGSVPTGTNSAAVGIGHFPAGASAVARRVGAAARSVAAEQEVRRSAYSNIGEYYLIMRWRIHVWFVRTGCHIRQKIPRGRVFMVRLGGPLYARPRGQTVRGSASLGNCPGSRACDWVHGPSGVFAYLPRGSV